MESKKEEFKELALYLQYDNYAKVARDLSVKVETVKRRVRYQAIDLLFEMRYIPYGRADLHDFKTGNAKYDKLTEKEKQYLYRTHDVKSHAIFFSDLLSKYNAGDEAEVKEPEADNRLISSLTVQEFKELMQSILNKQ